MKKLKKIKDIVPLFQHKEVLLLNDAFDMFVNRGDKVISKLILIILSLFEPCRGVGLYLSELVKIMYPKYKDNCASKYKKKIKEVLSKKENFNLIIGKKVYCLLDDVYCYEDNYILFHINDNIIDYILYFDFLPKKKGFTGYFAVESSKINSFDSRAHFISIWLYFRQLTNNGYSLERHKIWKDKFYEKLGTDSSKNYADFNFKIFKPALNYIISFEPSWKCNVENIKMVKVFTRQYLEISIKVPEIKENVDTKIKEEKPKHVLNPSAPEFLKSFVASFK